MKTVSAAEMREIDRLTSQRFNVSSITLMENAGAAVARFVLSDHTAAKCIGVVCGKGNNGGDGFVAARKLIEAGHEVRVLLLSDPGELRGDAAIVFQRLVDRIKSLKHVRPLPFIARQPDDLKPSESADVFAADLMVDAILGTGFRPPLNPLYAAAIQRINESSKTVVAVDISSGANADSMHPQVGDEPAGNEVRSASPVVRAHAVVTFTAPRPAHLFGGLTKGPIVISDIGSPEAAVVSQLGIELSTPADFASLLEPRASDSNKGNYGHVLVIGGSLGKAGAAAMAGFAALRAGAGLSTVATPKSVLPTVAGFHPELMTEALSETPDGTIARQNDAAAFASLLKRKTLAIGPGISRNPVTSEFVRATLQQLEKDSTAVVDADALNAFEGRAEMLNGRGRTLIITPHPGEMSRLTGLTIPQIQKDRLEVARKFAREHELIVVLKGHRTLIATPDGTVWVNPSGNPGMATGGTGDVLTGMVAGLVAQHPQNATEATALAVYLHGLAGDIARDSVGESSLVATDLITFLPQAFARARNEQAKEFRLQGS